MNNRKILKSLVILILTTILLITFSIFGYKAFATSTNEMASAGIGDPPQFPYVRHTDLIEMYNILCSQKGTHLTGENGTLVKQGDQSSSEGYLTFNNIGKKLFEKSQNASSYTTDESFTNPYTSASSSTYGLYKKTDAISCTPSEAYILSEMSENTYKDSSDFYNITNKEYKGEVTDESVITISGVSLYGIDLKDDGHGEELPTNYVVKKSDGKYYYVELTSEANYFPYTYVQYAWWTTKAGGSTVVKATSLQKEAEAFEAYINKVAKRDSNNQIVTEEKTVTINGITATIKVPVIDFKIKKHTDKAKSYYDEKEKKFLVGPFSIDYCEESVTSDRGTINFSEVTGATLESNLGEVNKKDWKFAFPERSGDNEDRSSYPHNGETFYVILNYKEGMTKISDLHFTFRYMNAGGNYEKLTGEYFKASWEPESEAIWCNEESSYCECGGTSVGPHREKRDDKNNVIGYECNGGAKACSHGYYHTHIIKWNYWLELKDLDPKPSQALAEGLVGVRWYETAEISLIAKLPKTIDISGTKTWNDNNNKDGKRPKQVIVVLYKNGKKTNQTRKISEENGWKYEFKNLPKTDEKGERIIYTVVETGVKGYSTTYKGNDIINTPDEPETVDISGTKTWEDNNNEDGTRPEKVIVTLYRNGKKTNQTRKMNKDNGWKYEFKDLPKTDDDGEIIAYTVVETKVLGYVTSYKGYDIINTPDEPGIKLTIPMAGEVWIDTDPDKAHNTKYGYKDDGEKPYEKAEVYVYKVYLDKNGKEVKRQPAKIYGDDNETEIKFPVYTDADGKYKINNILVPGTEEEQYKDCTIKYDVVFAYDGQNYEASDFLPSANGNASTYINSNKEERKKYQKDSMAIETVKDRDTFNKRFSEISGSKPIDDNGNTEGKSKGEDKEYRLDYTSEEYKLSKNSDKSRRISKLTTTDKDGYILEQFKMKASTGNAGIVYPFANKISIETADDVEELSVKIEDGIKVTTYKTLYEYMLHINLAVKERDEADLAVGKDLYKAQIVVNEKSLTYKYNTLYDFEEEKNKDFLNIQLEAAKAKPYTLGLYSSDYAYRSKVYSKSANIVKSIKHDTELRAFLTYKVVAYNESEGYEEVINLLNDYYDSSFTLIKDDLSVDVLNNEGVRESKVVAEKTYYRILPGMEPAKYKYNSKEDTANYPSGNISWTQDTSFNGSSDYKKMTTDSLKDIKLKEGERIEIFVTFEVDKAGFLDKDSKERKNLLGEKNNIAEISNYSTYYKGGKVAGRIDKDSAPDNIDFKKNEKSWYEDDTESAPVINIELYNTAREINGFVWEDLETNELKYNQKVGNGIYDSNENGISNLDVELVEKILIDDTEYEYIWPADAFSGTVAENNYNPTDVTKEGKYSFKGFVAGNYVVRFKYGNREDSIKYNGQDYKNTSYQENIKNSDGKATLNNEWHDLKDKNLREAKVSDARDYELQRMKVIAYSRKITNKEGSVLETADSKTAGHTELISNTQMVANTAKLNLELERQDYIDYGSEKSVNGIKEYTYIVSDIDFGLEKRSETVMELTKDLYSITLYKNNGTSQIMKVIIKEDGTYDFDVSEELAKLLRVAKTKNEQGFSYINMESSYLKDLTIKLGYKIKVNNKSEVDWTGLLAEFDNTKTAREDILAEVEKLEDDSRYVSGKNINYGDYVGLNYYNNKNNDSDKIVTTKVEKIIDYIDNNISINSAETSAVQDSAWVNISTDTLKAEKLLDDKVYTTLEDGRKVLADEMGNIYDTETRKNIYVTDSEIYNKKMIAKLVPETAKETGIATSGEIMIVTSKTITSEETADNLNFDNIAEILVYSNTVGRRDEQSVPGNAEISRGAFTAATGISEEDGKVVTEYKGAKDIKVDEEVYSLNGERDTDAAEFVTFTDPTGYNGMTGFSSNIEYIIATVIGCIILAGGIVTIKIKVVNKDNKNKKIKK